VSWQAEDGACGACSDQIVFDAARASRYDPLVATSGFWLTSPLTAAAAAP